MSDQAHVRLENIGKRYPGQPAAALSGVNLAVREGEFLTLLGPSGSGKTTLLNILAGFLAPSSGRVLIAGKDVTELPPERRDIGMVFQNYALFPHMSVAQNVEFPLKQRKLPRATRRQKVRAVLRLVQLEDKAGVRPRQLSGGQQQRVALARALVFEPDLLLMDEPLGALDKTLRGELQKEIRRLHRAVGKTLVFVTHDQEEALALSDRIAVVHGGGIAQVNTAEHIYRQPDNLFVARFLGESIIIHGHRDRGSDVLQSELGALRLHPRVADRAGKVALIIRPEHARIRPLPDAPGAATAAVDADHDAVFATITDRVYQGREQKVYVKLDDGSDGIVIEAGERATPMDAGTRVRLQWPVGGTWLV